MTEKGKEKKSNLEYNETENLKLPGKERKSKYLQHLLQFALSVPNSLMKLPFVLFE